MGDASPPILQTVGIQYAMLPHIFLFQFRNQALVSHQVVPLTLTTKLRS